MDLNLPQRAVPDRVSVTEATLQLAWDDALVLRVNGEAFELGSQYAFRARRVPVRLRPARKNHVWAYDCVHMRLYDGTGVRLLTVMDEYSRECPAIRAGRSIRSTEVIEVLAELVVFRGVPDHIRSDNGPGFTAPAVCEGFVMLRRRETHETSVLRQEGKQAVGKHDDPDCVCSGIESG